MKILKNYKLNIIKSALSTLLFGIDSIVEKTQNFSEVSEDYKKGFNSALSEVKNCIIDIIDIKL